MRTLITDKSFNKISNKKIIFQKSYNFHHRVIIFLPSSTASKNTSMRINNVYKYSTLIVCIKITPPFLTLFHLSLLLLRVSDNSVNTSNRQKYWNFEPDLKDIYFFSPFVHNGSERNPKDELWPPGKVAPWNLHQKVARKLMGSMWPYSEEQISSTQTRIVATRVLIPNGQWLVVMHHGCLQIGQMPREASIAWFAFFFSLIFPLLTSWLCRLCIRGQHSPGGQCTRDLTVHLRPALAQHILDALEM